MYIKGTYSQICVCMQSLRTDLCVQLEIKCNLVDISSFTDSPSSEIDLKILLSWIFPLVNSHSQRKSTILMVYIFMYIPEGLPAMDMLVCRSVRDIAS